jgi:hypothetical protein
MIQYERLWRNKFLTLDAKTIDDFIMTFESVLSELKEWKAAGIILDPESGTSDDYATFITVDKQVADQYGFEMKDWQEEFWEDEEWKDELADEYTELLRQGMPEAEAQELVYGTEDCRQCSNCYCSKKE